MILQVGVTAIAIRQSCSFDVHALPEALVAIRDGKMAATVDQYPSRQARGALDIIVAYLREGKQPEQHDNYLTPALITAENLGEAERAAEAGIVVATPEASPEA